MRKLFNSEVKLLIVCVAVVLLSIFAAMKIREWHYYTYMNMDDAVEYVELTNGVGILMKDGSSIYLEIPKKER